MTTDLPWQLYRSFLAVLHHGSLSAAARALGATQPTLGRHVQQLEAGFGAALFTRSPSGLLPTEAALALVAPLEAMEAAAATALRIADGLRGGDRGTVRITASEMVGGAVLPEMLAVIQRRHPGITLELVLSNRTGDLLRRDADIAVRMLRPIQEALLARRIGEVRVGLFAHRDYLIDAGTPTSPEALAGHRLVGFDRDDLVARGAQLGEIAIDRGLFSFRTDSDLARFAAIRAGLGIGACQAGIASRHPELVAVLPDQVLFRLETWLVMHEDQRANHAVRLVFDELGTALDHWIKQSEGFRA